MTSSRPYLLRAIYEWLLDNGMTPYIMVNAMMPEVQVPERYVENGSIVLNISPQAVGSFVMNNESLEFAARFSGIREQIFVPIKAVNAIYAYENGRGMVFSEEEESDSPPSIPPNSAGDAAASKRPPKRGKPQLKIVK